MFCKQIFTTPHPQRAGSAASSTASTTPAAKAHEQLPDLTALRPSVNAASGTVFSTLMREDSSATDADLDEYIDIDVEAELAKSPNPYARSPGSTGLYTYTDYSDMHNASMNSPQLTSTPSRNGNAAVAPSVSTTPSRSNYPPVEIRTPSGGKRAPVAASSAQRVIDDEPDFEELERSLVSTPLPSAVPPTRLPEPAPPAAASPARPAATSNARLASKSPAAKLSVSTRTSVISSPAKAAVHAAGASDRVASMLQGLSDLATPPELHTPREADEDAIEDATEDGSDVNALHESGASVDVTMSMSDLEKVVQDLMSNADVVAPVGSLPSVVDNLIASVDQKESVTQLSWNPQHRSVRVCHSLTAHSDAVTAIAISRDAKVLYTAHKDGLLKGFALPPAWVDARLVKGSTSTSQAPLRVLNSTKVSDLALSCLSMSPGTLLVRCEPGLTA